MTIRLDQIFYPSEDIVAREIEGELIIVPLKAGIGDLEDELFTLNDTGKAIWSQLDGKRTLGEIVTLIKKEYDAPEGTIEQDVLGLAEELFRRKMLVEIAPL